MVAVIGTSGQSKGIAIGGTMSERDRTLLRHYFGDGAEGLPPQGAQKTDAEDLKRNKLSVLAFSATEETVAGVQDPQLLLLITEQHRRHQQWQQTLSLAGPLFDPLGTEFVLMKALKSPFALMSDVDYLVPLPEHIACLAAALEGAGFALYRFRILSHPLKIMAEESELTNRSPANIDLYPDAMWIRKHVLDGAGVVTRRRRGSARGLPTWEPSAEDDLYLVATHAFAHGEIHLAELDHGARILAHEPFDWERVLATAVAFGCEDAVYAYVRLLKAACRAANLHDPVPNNVVATLEAMPACKGVRVWLDRLETPRLPLRIPVWLCTARSAWHHLPAASRRLRWTETLCDAATHMLTAGSLLLGRG